MVLVESQDTSHTMKTLLKESPLHLKAYNNKCTNQASLASKSIPIEDTFVSINQFYPSFNPKKPFDFKHLITIQLPKCNQFQSSILDSIF